MQIIRNPTPKQELELFLDEIGLALRERKRERRRWAVIDYHGGVHDTFRSLSQIWWHLSCMAASDFKQAYLVDAVASRCLACETSWGQILRWLDGETPGLPEFVFHMEVEKRPFPQDWKAAYAALLLPSPSWNGRILGPLLRSRMIAMRSDRQALLEEARRGRRHGRSGREEMDRSATR